MKSEKDSKKSVPEPEELLALGCPGWVAMAALLVLLGAVLIIEWPGLLFVLLPVAAPLTIWLVVASRKRATDGDELASSWATGGAAIFVATLVGLTAFIAFCATCVWYFDGQKW